MKELAAVVGSVLFLGAAWLAMAQYRSQFQEQPIAYNHKKHIESGLECGNCHAGIAEQKARAGLPGLEVCVSCHAPDDGNPKAKAIQTYASENRPIPWKRVYRVPEHVYFSHRRHVAVAKLDCSLCHGDMAKLETPVARPAVAIRMDRCIECHARSNVTTDCLSCHR